MYLPALDDLLNDFEQENLTFHVWIIALVTRGEQARVYEQGQYNIFGIYFSSIRLYLAHSKRHLWIPKSIRR